MKTSTIILIIIGVLAGIAFSVFMFVSIYDIFLQDPYGPGGEKEVVDRPEQVNINVAGEEIVIENAVLSMRGEYELLRSNESYKIVHLIEENRFQIVVYAKPFPSARRVVEREFLQILEIDEEVACELNVGVSTPLDVDATYGGQEYGLSFCE